MDAISFMLGIFSKFLKDGPCAGQRCSPYPVNIEKGMVKPIGSEF